MDLENIVIMNIKKYRKLRGISQERLAEKCNTSTSYIGLMETGKNIPKLSTIERIANALEVEPYRLFLDNQNTINETKIDTILKEIKSVLKHHI